MPIPLFVPGDPAACRECADRLQALANGVTEHAGAFDDARGKSESEWVGTAGDEFRDRVAEMNRGTNQVAESAEAAAAAIRAFADDLETAANRMRQAAEIAAASGLRVQPGPGAPGVIEDPDPIAVGAGNIDAEVRYAQQCAAFDEAAEMARSSRAAESNAHAVLQGVVEQLSAAVQDMRGQWYWMATAAVTGYIGTAAAEVGKWAELADIHRGQLDKFRSIAADAVRSGDPYWETRAANAVATFESASDDAAKVITQNSRLVAGATDNVVVRALSASIMNEGTSAISKVGSKIPIVGVGLTGVQTTVDVMNAEDNGDAALVVVKNTSGFLAGTGATALILASVAGGPATIAAVGVGALVTWGTGYAIGKIWGD
ncbi:putative T7SS-secreted protein [Rhodococcus sp. BE178]|uniref:WXG100-like domain-containing protein n=1 Tax=Rhodococcus sp. BE178 TaxID=2817737 RepID=UPI003D205A3A